MKRLPGAAIALFLSLPAGLAASAWADGGTVQLMEQVGATRITVFTSPSPLRAGFADVSVLVQDAQTGDLCPCQSIRLRLAPRDSPQSVVRAVASSDEATNKLMQAALVELPEPGTWELEVACRTTDGLQTVTCPLEVALAPPRWVREWPWFTWPLAVMPLFALHRRFVTRRRARSIPAVGTAGLLPIRNQWAIPNAD